MSKWFSFVGVKGFLDAQADLLNLSPTAKANAAQEKRPLDELVRLISGHRTTASIAESIDMFERDYVKALEAQYRAGKAIVDHLRETTRSA